MCGVHTYLPTYSTYVHAYGPPTYVCMYVCYYSSEIVFTSVQSVVDGTEKGRVTPTSSEDSSPKKTSSSDSNGSGTDSPTSSPPSSPGQRLFSYVSFFNRLSEFPLLHM